jgi:hypothetical protein
MHSVVILPQFAVIPLPNPDLPEQVLHDIYVTITSIAYEMPVCVKRLNYEQLIQSVSMVLSSDAAFRLEELQALAGTWDGEKRMVSKYDINS